MSSASLDGRSLKRIAIAGANYVNQKRLELNNINVFPVPDGDTGTNLALTLLAAAQAADELKEKPPIGEVARTLARASLFGAKGNSGFILSQLFCGLADELEGKRKANVPELAGAFNSGVLRAYQAVSNPREGTVLTVMRETFDYGAQIAEKTTDIREWLGTILLRSRQVLSLTPELLPVLKQQGVVDSGGQGFVYFLEGMVRALGTEELYLPDTLPPLGIRDIPTLSLASNPIEHRYCTELILKNSRLSPAELRWRLAPLGSSLVVVGDKELVRIHIHTDDPENIARLASEWGSAEIQKVDDMKEQQKALDQGRKQGTGRTLVITDSTADLPPELVKRYGIRMVPLEVLWNEQVYKDGIDIDPATFYTRLQNEANLPSTSQPSPGSWETAYDIDPKEYGGIFSVHLSGKLSGTVRTASAFAHSKNHPIQVMDSLSVTLGLGLLTVLAAGMAKQGVSLYEISKVIDRSRHRVKVLFCPKTLTYLQKGGRIGKTSAWLGNLLRLKPILTIDQGSIVVKEKVLGSEQRSLDRMIAIIREERKGAPTPLGDLWFGVMHTASPELGEQIRERIMKEFDCPKEHILLSEAGPVLGTYVGPGAFGITYWI